MATLEDRLQSIRVYVETYTGRDTYIGDSGFTQPSTAYCTVKLIANIPYQHDLNTDLDGITEEVRGLRKLTYSVKAIGGDPEAVLHRLQSSFRADVPMRTLTDQEIGLLFVGQVTDISLPVGGKIEERAVINIDVSASIPEVFDYESATEAQIEIDAGMSPTQNFTVPDEPDCPV